MCKIRFLFIAFLFLTFVSIAGEKEKQAKSADTLNVWISKVDLLKALELEKQTLLLQLSNVEGRTNLVNAMADSVKIKKSAILRNE